MILEELIKVVKKYPKNIALLVDNKKITYKELFDYSLTIASKLKQSGIKNGDFVTIELDRNENYVSSMIASWLVGACFIALEKTYPKERIEFICKDSNTKIRINDEFIKDINKFEKLKEYYLPKEDDNSLLIYTSGSTGSPKGVLHTHLSIYDGCNRVASAIGLEKFNKVGEIFGQVVPLSFIAGISNTFISLINGLVTSIASPNILRDSYEMSNYLFKDKINIAYIPPKVLKVITIKGNYLHTVITGSEKLSNVYRKEFRLLNIYGSSELGGGLSYFEVKKEYENTPIGKTYGKEKIYILDENNNEVEEGEMCISGNFAKEYLNHKELTKSTFVPNPFKDRDGFSTLFHSSDIGRKLSDGNILYLNRKDWMIKINGQRVEPGEIESVIKDNTNITDCVVKDFNKNNNTYLCAYYVTKNNIDVDIDLLKKDILSKLPSYMVPTFFIKLDKLPTNNNGKLNRNLLPDPEIKKNKYIPPKTEIEKKLISAIEKVLIIDNVGLNDNFFDLGGDSIKVLYLESLLPEYNLNTKVIYEAKNISEIAKYITNNTNLTKDIGNINKIVPLTKSQLGIFYSCIKDLNKPIYNNPIIIKFPSSTDINLLQESISSVIKSHYGLFSTILINDDIPSMKYNTKFLKEDICSVTSIKEKEFDKYKLSLLKPFDIFKDRLFRFNITKTEKNVYLFMDIHHIIFDGYSMQILFPQILDKYNGLEIKKEKYTSYDVSTTEEKEISKYYKQARKYYLDTFSSVEEVSLPTGDKNLEEISFKDKDILLDVDFDLLNECSHKYKVSENVILSAAFGYLLSCYTNKKESAFATVYNGRKNNLTNNTVAMMVRTLPILCTNDMNLSINDYLLKLKDQILKSMVNDSYSFIDLVKETNYSSDVLFTYQGDLFNIEKYGSKDIQLIKYPYIQTGEILAIQVYPKENKININIQYLSSVYSEEFINNLVKNYRNVLINFLTKNLMDEVSLLTDEEIEKVKEISYGGYLKYDTNLTFVDLFLKAKNKYPNKIAVSDINSSYTYLELDDASNKIAKYLLDNNIQANEFVGIKLNRVKEFIACIIGIQKVGCGYIPLDKSYPSERIEYMINDSKTKIVLDEKIVSKILLRKDNKEINYSNVNSPAYMIYTSGSTGNPKGVVILNKSLSAAIAWRIRDYNLSSNSRNASHASFSFDASVDDIFPILSVGGSIHIMDEVTRKDIDLMYKFLVDNKITGITLSTQIGMTLINSHPDLNLDYMILGGEKLLPTKKTKFKLFNGYGPTEFTVCSSYHIVNFNEKDIPIGKAVPNTYSFVFDPFNHLLPIGMIGELSLGGIQVSNGYFNKEELTNSRFISSRYLNDYKVYKTGDLVRYNFDNNLEYIGRIDFQVKLRGFRIELGEIENVASTYDGINSTAAEVKNNLLVLYYTSSEDISKDSLKKYLSSKLTSYMVPNVFVRLNKMPLTPNGKINRKELPEIKNENLDIIKPRNGIEKKIYETLISILKYSNFGIKESFDEIGLTSLSLMQLVSTLSKDLKVNLKVTDLVKHNNVELLAKFISSISLVSDTYNILEEYPLTIAQKTIISDVISNPYTTIYNVPTLISLPKNIDIEKLIDSINKVINLHPYLKARISIKDNNIFVIRNDKLKIKIEQINNVNDYSLLVTPFDIFNEPLCRIKIINNNGECKLFIDAHHLIFDGVSLDIFLSDLSKVYLGNKVEKEKFTNYEYSLVEEKLIKSKEYNTAKKYYSDLLTGFDFDSILIKDKDDKEKKKGEIHSSFKCDINKINEFCIDNNITINSIFLSSLGLTLSKYLNRSDSFFTTVYSGRNDSRVSNSIGMFVHTLPVICKPYDLDSITYIKNISNQIKNSMASDIYSFSEIAKEYSLSSDIIFVYEGKIGSSFTLGENKITDIKSLSLDSLKSKILIVVVDNNTGFDIHVEYDSSLYDKNNIKSFIESLKIVFLSLLNNVKTNDISLLDDKRRKELISFNSTSTSIKKTDVVSLFKESIKKYPNNVAIIYNDKKITYSELDKITNIIAAHLVSNGIKKGKVVSLLLTRNEYMVILPLAVLKTGATYQPLDYSYPSDRLNFMLKDASSSFLITEKELVNKININIPTLLVEDINKLQETKVNFNPINYDDLMILLYTSGTTGIPKGVKLTHLNIVNFIYWYQRYYKLTSNSVVSAYAGFGFDACMMDIFPAISTGASICIVDEKIRLEMNELNKYFEKNKVSHVFMTTQVGRLFALSNPKSKIKHLSVGGEKLLPLDLPKTYKMHNGYGPTECTIFSTIQEVDKKYYRIPIGKPLDNYKLYVVDSNYNELPTYACGQLLITGYGVGKGYLNNDSKTSDSFIKNPFSDESGFSIAYKTGDIVRRLSDGRIDYIGRNDSQIKIRGFRIEISEIDICIRSFSNIKDCATVAYSKDDGNKYLVTYYVSDINIDINKLKEHIKKEKPSYMVPSYFIKIDSIPLTQNQKLNIKALPKPKLIEEKNEYVLPTTPIEKELCNLFTEILGIKKISINDSFFDLGGSSIDAAKISIYMVNKKYNVSYQDIFSHPSVKELSNLILNKKEDVSKNDELRVDNYDDILKYNSIKYIDDIKQDYKIKKVLLTGATGFLGIHILKELIDKNIKIITLIRGGKISPLKRLKSLLMYYFDSPLDDEINNYVQVIEGDITDANLITKLSNYDFDTIINSAAVVKHFSSDDSIELVNVEGVKNLIDVAKNKKARLVQVSTISVAGENINHKFSNKFLIKENQLYFGQDLSNKYAYSKFKAEELIFNAIKDGLDARIIRVGNLMSRNKDGEFQINSNSNSFIRSLRSYVALKAFPNSLLDKKVDFSPIDETAKSILLLSTLNKKFVVFHSFNSNQVKMEKVIKVLNEYKFNIKIVDDNKFNAVLNKMLLDENKNVLVSSLLSYSTSDNLTHEFIQADNSYTKKVLSKFNYSWPETSDEYLKKLVYGLITLGQFD